jgi:3-deoxy-D-manno-octulosonate 8-phosphate phosphatase (KDO 8-P phosphatase)
MEEHASLAARCSAIDWLVIDVDGVLTDGRIIYSAEGDELKHFHVRDGSGLKIWHFVGKRSAIITGRSSRVVKARGKELGVESIIQGAAEKLPAYRQLLTEKKLRPEQVCCICDDTPDVGLLRNCGLAVTVADACPDAVAEAHYVTRAAGGRGAVREAVELILRCQGHWQRIVERFRGERL